MKIKVNHME